MDVWRAFEEISRIPRGEDSVERLADYIYNEALSHDMKCYMDEKHNVVVWIPASNGMGKVVPITVQAHMHTLGIQADESEHEFEENGIELLQDGDRLWANGTTLGADNHIGIAMMMALFRSKTLIHPEMELVFSTTTESGQKTDFEIGDVALKGRRLINLDYNENGVLLSGTSGVMVSELLIPLSKNESLQKDALFISVEGLRGGHSILDIDRERGNAIEIMGRLLTEVKEECQLVDIYAKHHFNSIPTTASAIITTEIPEMIKERLEELFEKIIEEHEETRGASLTIEYRVIETASYDSESFDKLLSLIALTPNGIISKDLSTGLPSYTNNMYKVSIDNGILIIGNITRYSKQTLGKDFSDKLCYLTNMLKGDVKVITNMPVWEPDDDKLMDITTHAYDMHAAMYLQVKFSHEATETTVLGEMSNGSDVIVLSPAIQSAHTVNESIAISSVQRAYNIVKSILAFS